MNIDYITAILMPNDLSVACFQTVVIFLRCAVFFNRWERGVVEGVLKAPLTTLTICYYFFVEIPSR